MGKTKPVKFLVWGSLSYGARIYVVLATLLAGIGLQAFIHWGLGAPLILLGGLLLVPKGLTNEEQVPSVAKRTWEKVTADEMGHCLKRLDFAQEWAKKGNLGCGSQLLILCLILAAILMFLPADAMTAGGFDRKGPVYPVGRAAQFVQAPVPSQNLRFACGFDCIVLGICLLLGTVRSWVPGELEQHLDAILNVLAVLQKSTAPDIRPEPMLEMAQTRTGGIPTDARLMIRFKRAPDGFMGIQVQVSTNSVQGKQFPYLYCVLLAKPEFGLVDRVKPNLGAPPVPRSAQDKKNRDRQMSTFAGHVVEVECDEDVDVVVVRQVTFGTGYHTDASGQVKVVSTALSLAREVLRG